MKTEKLIINDILLQETHIYTIKEDIEVNEDLITRLGFDVGYCNWMVCANDLKIVTHNGIILR